MNRDIRQRKFRLAFAILAVGMLAAYAWYTFQWLMDNGYPYNTFLFLPKARFSDFTDTVRAALNPSPYLVPFSAYPPTAYALFRFFGWMPMSLLIFFIIGIFPIILLLFHVMRPILSDFSRSILKSLFSPNKFKEGVVARFMIDNIAGVSWVILLLVFCEPFVFLLDRGNNELWVILMVGLSLYYFSTARFYTSLAWLVLPICLKLYPGLLLLLFLRRKKWHLIVLAVAATLAITVASYSCFSGGVVANYLLNERLMAVATEEYLVENLGLMETASPWNLYRSFAITTYAIETGTYFDSWWNWYPLMSQFRDALKIYSCCVLAVGAFIAGYAVLIEKEVLRRMVVLLLFMVLCSPVGGEYKMTHIGTALIVLILIRTHRRGDFLVTALLAFTLIPKREYIFECFGPSDSGFADVPAGITLNPLAMLGALGVLCWYGMAKADWKWSRQRLHGLWTDLCPAWMRKSYRVT